MKTKASSNTSFQQLSAEHKAAQLPVTDTARARQLLMAAVALLALLILTYSNHWSNGFHFDDSHTIENNAYIRSLSHIPEFYTNTETFSSLPGHGSYRPIVTTMLAIDNWLGLTFSHNPLEPFWYHLSTFIFFLLQGPFVYYFFRKLLQPYAEPSQRDWISFIATGFYMVHPVLAETINYVIAQSDSISTCFMLIAFVSYMYSERARRQYLYFIPLIIGAFAKPTALMFAPMLIVYHLLYEQHVSLAKPRGYDWKLLIKTVAPVMLLEALLYAFMHHMELGTFNPGGYSLFRYVITQPLVYLRYVGQFFLPTALSADSDWGAFESLADPECIGGFAFLALFIAVGLWISRFPKWRPVTFGMAFFLIALIPTSVVPLAEVTNDHRMFFPFVGLTIAVFWTLYLTMERLSLRVPARAMGVAVAVVLCAYAFGTHVRNETWRTEETLWHDVTIKSPRNGRGLMNYGLIFLARGSLDTANMYFTEALRFTPYYGALHTNLGIVQSLLGHHDESLRYHERAVALDPEDPEVYHFYGRTLKRFGQKDDAITQYYKSLQYSESNLDVRHELMQLLFEQSRFEELKKVTARTLALVPGDSMAIRYASLAASGKSALQVAAEDAAALNTPEGYLELSLRYYQAGDYQGSITAAKAALKLKPDYAEAYSNICAAENQLGQFQLGREAGEAALKIKPDYPLARANLAWSLRGLEKK